MEFVDGAPFPCLVASRLVVNFAAGAALPWSREEVWECVQQGGQRASGRGGELFWLDRPVASLGCGEVAAQVAGLEVIGAGESADVRLGAFSGGRADSNRQRLRPASAHELSGFHCLRRGAAAVRVLLCSAA